jgi:D-alanine-D-alanine ligase-like ATP-grasp enzyme
MPWRYFQLNAGYFNKGKGIYSKQDINDLVPREWRLEQWLDSAERQPESYPVFEKPEWGQNSKGIKRADSSDELKTLRSQRTPGKSQYLIQEAAQGKIEFEIFIIPSDSAPDRYAMLSVTQVINHSGENFPINGIYNKQTEYQDVTPQLSKGNSEALWEQLKTIGHFRISRFGVRADSLEELIDGKFKVIEINLFLPMPLVLLTKNTSVMKKISLATQCTSLLAKITRTIPEEQNEPFLFFKKLGFIQRTKHID